MDSGVTSEKPEVSQVENATERSQLARKRKAKKDVGSSLLTITTNSTNYTKE